MRKNRINKINRYNGINVLHNIHLKIHEFKTKKRANYIFNLNCTHFLKFLNLTKITNKILIR
jgi:hypothetical protein